MNKCKNRGPENQIALRKAGNSKQRFQSIAHKTVNAFN